ncbi:MAG: Hsp20/alpha crystallin family protein [Desulfohalobiaceae bacterium]|nr:Hsp20/alpha crystallin family protein [Desulfohalobiaceae bacterium]
MSDNRDQGSKKGGIEGILGGLGDLVDKLGTLADKGEKLSRSGEFEWEGKDKDVKGIYGFSVKFGIGGEEVKVEPFGNIRKDENSGQTVVEKELEPVVDVFEEDDHILIVAEMPGISREDVVVTVQDHELELVATKGQRRYRKQITLSRACPQNKVEVNSNNGIVEIRC